MDRTLAQNEPLNLGKNNLTQIYSDYVVIDISIIAGQSIKLIKCSKVKKAILLCWNKKEMTSKFESEIKVSVFLKMLIS